MIPGPPVTRPSRVQQAPRGLLYPDSGDVIVPTAIDSPPCATRAVDAQEIRRAVPGGALFGSLNLWTTSPSPARQHPRGGARFFGTRRGAACVEGRATVMRGSKMPTELSGGNSQRAGLRAALVLDPCKSSSFYEPTRAGTRVRTRRCCVTDQENPRRSRGLLRGYQPTATHERAAGGRAHSVLWKCKKDRASGPSESLFAGRRTLRRQFPLR